MMEDKVIDESIKYLQKKRWLLIYRTSRSRRAGGAGEHGGVDVIMMKDSNKFLFAEAKGDTRRKTKQSADFTSCLGSLIKRMRLTQGYGLNEAVDGFVGVTKCERKKLRDLVLEKASFSNSEYVVAFTDQYAGRLKESVDCNFLKKILKTTVLLVGANGVRIFRV
ncbi:MAG: hypothetical protein V2A66_06825 [Pseudomonadota bacterium]